ncbi:MAG TPA: hypothetical protein P5567_14855 [Kiritimatiellia bacterium]|nr:hypothetical protein [Kiritimatiellia bacterium]HRZ13720.1 hypothetical protein [Kiritimatiellia bacterium]HSA19372.1 hypothetical protein [Kiritimatiellia bacterium]
MKIGIICLAVMLAGLVPSFGDESRPDSRALIAAVVQGLGEKAINAFPDPSPILWLLETNPDFRALCAASDSTWQQTFSALVDSSLDRASRLVLLHSYLYLSPKEYANCLDRVLALHMQGILPQEELLNIFLFPPRDENRWFLSYNADDPRVKKFLGEVRVAFANNTDVLHMIDIITSGKARARDERLRSGKSSAFKRQIPSLAGEDIHASDHDKQKGAIGVSPQITNNANESVEALIASARAGSREALLELGDRGNPDVIPFLKAIMSVNSNKSFGGAGACAQMALVKLGDTEALAEIAAELEAVSTPWVQDQAIQKLEYVANSNAVGLLLMLLTNNAERSETMKEEPRGERPLDRLIYEPLNVVAMRSLAKIIPNPVVWKGPTPTEDDIARWREWWARKEWPSRDTALFPYIELQPSTKHK